ncbi:hypothetical protein PENTCL1PPCAC_21730, partial [Pristionchus entomophagus]
ITSRLFPNIILIDQSSWMTHGLKEGYTKPKSALIANCDNDICMIRANKLSLHNYTSSKPQVSCFIHQLDFDKVESNPKNLSCRGLLLYKLCG